METHECYSPHYGPYAYTHKNNYNYDKTGGLNSASKFRALLYCCVLLAVGTGFRFMVIWREIKRREACSNEISLTLKEVKERSRKLGREQAIIEMQKRFSKNNFETNRKPDD